MAPCNCGKSKRKPLMSSGVSTTTTTQPRMQGTTQRY